MWISSQKLRTIKQQEYDAGMQVGYRLGYHYANAKRMSLADLQIGQILKDKGIADNMMDYWKHLGNAD